MSLETPRLRLLPCAPEHLLALIDQPERFEQVLGLPAADGLHGFYVSDDVSPTEAAAALVASLLLRRRVGRRQLSSTSCRNSGSRASRSRSTALVRVRARIWRIRSGSAGLR